MTTLTIPGLQPGEDVIAAERAVVGAMVETRLGAELATEVLNPGDLWDGRSRIVFEAVAELLADSAPIAPAAVLGALGRGGKLGMVDGLVLADLVANAALVPSVRYYADAVRADSRRRRMLLALHSAARIPASHATWDPEADIDQIRALIDDAAATPVDQGGDMLADLDAILDDIENPPEKLTGVRPPYRDLERVMPSWTAGQLITVGARPGTGKTTLAQDTVRQSALVQGLPTVMFSLEMTRREILTRLLSAEAKVSLQALKPGGAVKPTDEELRRLVMARSRINEAPLEIRYAPRCSVEEIRGHLRTLARKQPARMVAVDYLQLMAEPKGGDNREQKVARNIRDLKHLAQDFETPLMVMSQLNRASTQRTDKKPSVSELRESGAIEQDSDIVILVHRPDMTGDIERTGEADLLVEKNRGGPSQLTVTVAAQLHYARFADMLHIPAGPSGFWPS